MKTGNPKIRQMPLITWLGGPYAIMLQLSHPAIASASCAHSRFVVDAMSRLRRTAAYIVSLTHGTEREQRLIAGMIGKQHAFIKSRHPRIGCGYDARDPELQKWVAATIFKGMMVVDEVFSSSSGFPTFPVSGARMAGHEGIFGFDTKDRPPGLLEPSMDSQEGNHKSWLFTACQYLGIKPPRVAMTRSEKESLLQEAAHLATSLDMPHDMWFSTLDEFEAYFEEMTNQRLLIVSPSASKAEDTAVALPRLSETSKKMGHTFLHAMNLPFWLFWLPSLMRLLARAWLPDNLRREFGLGSLHRKLAHSGIVSKDDEEKEKWTDIEIEEGLFWTTVMRWMYTTFILFIWLIDWLMPMWLENWLVGFLVGDMQFAATEIERSGRWPM